LHRLSGKGRTGLVKLLELVLFPSFCHICSVLLERQGERLVCLDCWENLEPLLAAHCVCCGRFFDGTVDSHVCSACVESPPSFIRHRSACRYRGVAKELILLYKYRRLRALGPDLARFLYAGLNEDAGLWWGADVLIPVPLHPRRQRQRGFNQSELLAGELSNLTGISMHAGLLRKRRDALPQTSLTGESRRDNLLGAYCVKNGRVLSDQVVILVDDVFTTGSTLQECSRTLLEAGAREVRAVSIAQA